MTLVDNITKYLREHAPQIAALMEKNLTVGDVHVPAAFPDISVAYTQGNEDSKVLVDRDDNKDDDEPTDLEEPPDIREMLRVARGSIRTVRQRKMFSVDVRKVDADQRKVFGWASISALDGHLIIDKQGDMIPIEELEKAAHEFSIYSRLQGDMHSEIGVGTMIENTVHNAEKRAQGIVAKDEEGRVIDGWYVGFQVHDDSVWAAYKRGERPELSIAGRSDWEEA